ncbi:hypothetical protein [Rheinheimera sp.]|uniref:hypothetical protein n=1 Tax=Rheinheimera sp. TaxID=1869214 RepID=UPI0027331430|nr:hypothetical protein [Rheinheimera sp.]MDP2716495.1 hypothetical protein [Rheinheimera sp.]
MYNAINTSEIKQITGKVNLNLESLIERMNAGEILELHLEATHGNGQLAPITFYPDDYESPKSAFEADFESPNDFREFTEIERRRWDAHIISNSLIFSIWEQALKQLVELTKEYGTNCRICIAVSCNSLEAFSFWKHHYVDHDVDLNFNPDDEVTIAGLNYLFDGKYDCFSFINPNNVLSLSQADELYAIVFDCSLYEGSYKIQNAVVAKVLD